MGTLGLVVALTLTPDSQPPLKKSVVVRFHNGPVVVSHGVRPYLTSGFEVDSRREQPMLIQPGPPGSQPKTRTAPALPQPLRNGKWIRFSNPKVVDRSAGPTPKP